MTPRARSHVTAGLVLVLVPLLALRAAAQGPESRLSPQPDPPAMQVDAIAGYAGFIDEDMIDHAVVGGAARWLITPRLGLGVEVLFMRGPDDDRDWSVMPLVSWDLRAKGRIVPYVAGGAGWLRTTLGVGTGLYSSSSWTVAGGGGVRIPISPAASLSVEGRIGTEPVARLTAAVGWRFGSR